MHWKPILTLLVLVSAATAAAAQGPAPGYDDPLVYASDYYQAKVEEVAADPVTFATNTSTEDVGEEAEHGLYVTCWTIVEQGIELEVCDEYYSGTPEFEPAQENEEVVNETAVQDTEEDVNATVHDTAQFLGETLDGLNETVADPSKAPAFLVATVEGLIGLVETILDRWTGAVEDRLGEAQALVTSLVDAVRDRIDELGTMSVSSVEALETLRTGLLGSSEAALVATAQTLETVGSGLEDARMGTVEAVSTAASDMTSATASALEAAGAAVAEAGTSLLDAVEATMASVQDTIRSWFGGDDEGRKETGDRLRDTTEDVGGLVDGVTDLVRLS